MATAPCALVEKYLRIKFCDHPSIGSKVLGDEHMDIIIPQARISLYANSGLRANRFILFSIKY